MPNAFAQLDAERAAETARPRQFAADLAAVVSTPEGMRLIAAHIADCGLMSPSYDERTEGRRSVGRELLDAVRRVAPDAVLPILKEIYDAA